MNKIFLIIFPLFFALGSISAQSFVSKVSQNRHFFIPQKNNSQDLRILAVLVEFQKDIDESTFGDGTFGSMYSKNYGTTILDPLPHNVQYFKNHLEFAKNYFAKTSYGKLNLKFDIYDQIIKVSKTIRSYSPINGDKKDYTPMVNFTKEVWDIVSTKGIKFSDYDMFMIFHAGVGGDVVLPGSLGNEKDLPSIFFNLNSFKKIFGDSFNGFSYSNGIITNTAILPSTESREIVGITGSSLLQLSINGLIVASIASYLGLPDLYNTETGISAVGRFALMDGQSIFTYGGLFPPELSVWEKYFLGWIQLEEVSSDKVVSVVNRLIATNSDTSFIKIPITSSEYFLIENRKRDAKKDGCKVTYKIGENYYTEIFTKDISTFSYYDVDSIKGVVVDVDEFDWALPGIDSDDNDSFEDIGLLIWHIDEDIINKNYLSNSINNSEIKGVRLVEADGIFDIGEKFSTIFGDEVIGDGSKEDTWYKDNPAHYYKNRFNDYSKPNAKSNQNAYSLISLNNFSSVGSKMTFNLTFGNDQIKKISRFHFPKDAKIIQLYDFDGEKLLFISNGKSISKFDIYGNHKSTIDFSSEFKPASFSLNGNQYFVGADSNSISIAVQDNNNFSSKIIIDSLTYTSAVVVNDNSTIPEFYVGTNNGAIYHYIINPDLSISQINSQKIFEEPIRQIVVGKDFLAAISDNRYWDSENETYKFSQNIYQFVIEESQDKNEHRAILLLSDNAIKIIDKGKIFSEFAIPGNSLRSFILGDLKKDGNNYILVYDNEIRAYNFVGALAENFPIKYSKGVIEDFILSDINNDDVNEILGFSSSGLISAYNANNAQLISSFPIATETALFSTPKLVKVNEQGYLLFQDSLGYINVIKISSDMGEIFWSELYGNLGNNSLIHSANVDNQNLSFFPENSAYNYPNPVYDDVTNIRFFVKENSKVEVKIFDFAGDLIDELTANAVGGMENELSWNVKNIPSGIYFANLKIKSDKGKSAIKTIKIAVVK